MAMSLVDGTFIGRRCGRCQPGPAPPGARAPGDGWSFDVEDRLVVCNSRFRELYPGLADIVVPGVAFETILRTVTRRGILTDTGGMNPSVKYRIIALRRSADDRARRLPLMPGARAGAHQASDEELLRAAWRTRGVVVFRPTDVRDDWARQALINEANPLYGRRPGVGR